MYRSTTRPILAAERALLDARVRHPIPKVSWASTAAWVALWSVGGVACMATLGRIDSGELGGVLAWSVRALLVIPALTCLFAVTALIASHISWARRYRQYRQEFLPCCAALLAGAQVEAKTVTATAVCAIAELTDEGNGYLFDIGGGELLFLAGERYRPIDDTMPWPSTEFDIVRAAADGSWIGVFSRGEVLEPSHTVALAECPEALLWAEEEERIEGAIEVGRVRFGGAAAVAAAQG